MTPGIINEALPYDQRVSKFEIFFQQPPLQRLQQQPHPPLQQPLLLLQQPQVIFRNVN